ncbi:hypothetical protein F5X98DRAFT_347131 [Xylaria grammica]|nr:hypothetical protein F5X98DRAFT_347131 [Xylaria grammica]
MLVASPQREAWRSAHVGRWNEAFKRLDETDQATLRTNAQHINIDNIIQCVEDKKADCDKKKWTVFKRHNGTEVKVRDVLGKIVHWIKKFESVGDIISSFDPVHAALPWAGVKFLVQIVVGDFETYAKMADGLEIISRVTVQVAEVERAMTCSSLTPFGEELSKTIVDIYVKVLKFLASARKFFEKRTGARLIKGVFQQLQVIVKELVDGMSGLIGEMYRLLNEVRWKDNNDDDIKRHKEIISQFKELSQLLPQPKIATQKQRAEIRRWLDPISTDDSQRQNFGLRHGTTCDWFLGTPGFKRWSKYDREVAKILWIHAPAGFGKSVLCARVINYMQKENANYGQVLFFYCSGTKPRAYPCAILKSWIWQLVAKFDKAVDMVREDKRAQQYIDEGTVASDADQEYLWTLLSKLIAQDSRLTLVVDGYDECIDAAINTTSKYDTKQYKVSFLRELAKTVRGAGVRVLLVSRSTADIEGAVNGLNDSSTDPATLEVSDYGVTKDDMREDLSSYSQTIFEAKIGKSENASAMADTAVDKSDGMFLWIALIDKSLSEGSTMRQARDLVTKTPRQIIGAYQAELDRILDLEGDNTERAVVLLKWILYAARPLTVREMTEALAVAFNDHPETYPHDDLPRNFSNGITDENYVQNCIRKPCGSLIELRKASEDTQMGARTVHLVHFSVQEFLSKTTFCVAKSNRRLCFEDAAIEHNWIARLCIQYMSLREFNQKFPNGVADMSSLRDLYPFFLYAAINWGDHYTRDKGNSASNNETAELVWRFFSTKDWELWAEILEQYLYQTSRDPTSTQNRVRVGQSGDSGYETLDTSMSDTYTESTDEADSSSSGEGKFKANTSENRVKKSSSAVYYAAMLGLKDIIYRMGNLNPGDCIVEGGEFGNPLQAAVVHKQHAAVKALLKYGANPSQRGGRYGTPLIAAVLLGSTEIFSILICAANDGLDVSDDGGKTALYHACVLGSLEMATSLIKRGANISINPKSGPSMFLQAVMNNHLSVVGLLLEHGADVNETSWLFRETALMLSVEAGREEMARLLLKNNANPCLANRYGATALHLACEGGVVPLVQLLLQDNTPGVDVEDEEGETPLHYAVRANAIQVVPLLLDHHASPSKGDEIRGRTPYQLAQQISDNRILKLFNEHKPRSTPRTEFFAQLLAIAKETNDNNIYRSLEESVTSRSICGVDLVRGILGFVLGENSWRLFSELVDYIRMEEQKRPKNAGPTDEVKVRPFWSAGETKLIEDSWGATKTQKDIVFNDIWGYYLDTSEVLPNAMLPIAVTNHAPEVVSLLLRRGADIHRLVPVRRKFSTSHSLLEYETSLQIAIRQNSYDLVELMLREGPATTNQHMELRAVVEAAGHHRGMTQIQLIKTLIAQGVLYVGSAEQEEMPIIAINQGHGAVLEDEDSDIGLDDDPPGVGDRHTQSPIYHRNEIHDLTWWEEALVGEWKGNYTDHRVWSHGFPEPASFRIDSVGGKLQGMPKNITLFHGGGDDTVDKFVIHGQALSGATFRFVKLYPNHGWMYEGSVEQQTKGRWCMMGQWGSQFRTSSGTFRMEKLGKTDYLKAFLCGRPRFFIPATSGLTFPTRCPIITAFTGFRHN